MTRKNSCHGVRAFFLVLGGCLALPPVNANRAEAQAFRHVYVPMEELQVLFGAREGVLLSRAEFLELWRRAHPVAEQPGLAVAADANTFFSAAAFSGRVEDQLLRLTGTVTIHKEKPGWQSLPLPLAGVAIASAKWEGQAASIGLDETGQPILLLEKTGKQELTLELLAPLNRDRAALVTAVRLPSVPGELSLTVPARHDVLVGGVKLGATPAKAPGAEVKFRIPLGGRDQLALSIVPMTDDGARVALLVARTRAEVTITPAQADWLDHIELEAQARPVEVVRLMVPLGLNVTGVESPGLSRSEKAEQTNGTLWTLRYQSPWTGTRPVTLRGQATPTLNAPWTVPVVAVVDAAMQNGQVVLHYGDLLTLDLRDLRGALRQASPARILSLRYWRADFQANLVVRPKVGRLATSVATLINATRGGLELRGNVTIEPRHAPLFDATLSLADRWQVTSVELQENAQRLLRVPFQAETRAGRRLLHVTLPKFVPDQGAVTLVVKADYAPRDWLKEPGSNVQVPLDTVAVEGAAEVEGMVLLRAVDEFRLTPTSLQGLETVPVARIPGADANVRLALRYQAARPAGSLEIHRRPVQWAVDTNVAVHLNDTHLSALYAVRYQVRGGASNQLTFELPDSVGNQVQVGILQGNVRLVGQTIAELADGRRRWYLRFDRDVTEPITLGVQVELARPEARRLPSLSVDGAIRHTGSIAVEAATEQELDLAPEELRPIDAAELPPIAQRIPSGRLVGAYQFRKLPYGLVVRETKHPEVPVLAGFCRDLKLTSVLDVTGTMTHEAVLQVENLGVQNLVLTLPPSSRLLSASLDGKAAEVRQGEGAYQIALPAATGAEAAKQAIRIFYQNQGRGLGLTTKVRQQPLQLNLPVLAMHWTMHVPRNQVLVQSGGSIRPDQPLVIATAMGATRALLLPDKGRRIFNPLEPIWRAFAPLAGSRAKRTFAETEMKMGEAPRNFDLSADKSPGSKSESKDKDFSYRFALPKMSALPKAPASPPGEPMPMMEKREESAKDGLPARKKADAGSLPMMGEGGDQLGKNSDAPRAAETPPPADNIPTPVAPVVAPATTSARGLLSLEMALNLQGHAYSFAAVDGTGELQLVLQDTRFTSTLTGVVALGTLLLGWLGRAGAVMARMMSAALLIGIPTGFATMVPLRWLFLLDGLFLGGLALAVLFAVVAIVNAQRTKKPRGESARATEDATGALPTSPVTLALLVAILLGGLANPGFAQDAPAAELPTIFVPYHLTQNPLQSNLVYLPGDQYQKLWEKANPDKVRLADPQTAALVAQAYYEGKIVGERAQFTARLTVWSFRDDWVSVTIPIARVLFGKVLLDGAPATLADGSIANPTASVITSSMPVRVESNVPPQSTEARTSVSKPVTGDTGPRFPRLFARGRGPHQVEMTFEVPVQRLGTTGNIDLVFGPSAAGILSLALPEENLEVTTTGLARGWRLDKGQFTAAVGQGGNVALRWRPPNARRAAELLGAVHQEARLLVESSGLVYLANFAYTIRQGTTQRLEIRVPDPIRVRAVAGEEVADWNLSDSGPNRRLVVTLTKPISQAALIHLDLLQPFPTGAVANPEIHELVVPEIAPLGLGRETGHWVVVGDSARDIAIREAQGLQRVNAPFPVTLPIPGSSARTLEGVALAAYRYSARPLRLAMRVAPPEARLNANTLSALVVERERVRLQALVSLTQTRVPMVSARLRLPRGFTLDAVVPPPDARWTLVSDDNGPILEIESTPTRLSDAAQKSHPAMAMGVMVEGWVARDPREPTFAVPALQVLQAARQQGEWAVFLAPGLDAQTDSLVGLRPREPAQLPTFLQYSLVGVTRDPVSARLGYTQFAWPAELKLRVRALQPRVRAHLVTVVSIRDTAVAYLTRMMWNIEQAGVSRLAFTVPEWLGQDLDVRATGVRQVESAPAGPGLRRFVVHLEREVLGRFPLDIVQVLPLPADNRVLAPPVAPLEVEGAEHYVVLENRAPDQLDLLTKLPTKARVEIDQVPMLARHVRQTAMDAFRLNTPMEVAWRMITPKPLEELPASVNLVDLTMVVDRDAHYRAQASYRVTNRLEQFLVLAFPPDAKIWSVFVAGQPSKPATRRRDDEVFTLVPLPKTNAGDFAAVVDIVYTGKLDDSRGWRRQWQIPSPEVRGLPVAQTQFTLYLPKDYDYGMFRGNMEEAEPSYLELNRESTQYREALQLLSVVQHGKGNARLNAASNLKNLPLDINKYQRSITRTDKGQQLLAQVRNETQQLAEAVSRLRGQRIPSLEEGNRAQTEEYFSSRDEANSLGDTPDDVNQAERNKMAQLALGNVEATDGALPPAAIAWFAQQENNSPSTRKPTSESAPTQYLPAYTWNEMGLDKAKGDKKKEVEDGRKSSVEQNVRSRLQQRLEEQTLSLNRPANGREAMGGRRRKGTGMALGPKPADEREQKVLESRGKKGEADLADMPANVMQDEADDVESNAQSVPEGLYDAEGKAKQDPQKQPAKPGAQTTATPSVPLAALAPPVRRGGLSLRIDLPKEGQPLHFVKVRGEPTLAMSVSSVENRHLPISLAWAAFCTLLSIGCGWTLAHPRLATFFSRYWRGLLASIGLVWWLALPWSVLGFVMFLTALIVRLPRKAIET